MLRTTALTCWLLELRAFESSSWKVFQSRHKRLSSVAFMKQTESLMATGKQVVLGTQLAGR